jgi:hypothetical protein
MIGHSSRAGRTTLPQFTVIYNSLQQFIIVSNSLQPLFPIVPTEKEKGDD